MAKTTFQDGKPIHITLGPDVRFMWPYVFEKRPNDDGEDKYEVVIQIPYANKKAIGLFEDAIDEAISRGYSGELSEKSTFKKGTKESALKLPLKDGADKADDDYADLFDGYMFATARTDRRPKVLDVNGQEIIDPEEMYSGAIGAVSITVYPYNNKSQGVGIQLNHIMKLDDGERIGGGGVSAEDAFAEYMGSGGERRSSRSRSRDEDERPTRGRSESRSRGRDDEDDAPRRGESRSRSRDAEDDDERRPSRGSSRSRGRGGSDDPMFD